MSSFDIRNATCAGDKAAFLWLEIRVFVKFMQPHDNDDAVVAVVVVVVVAAVAAVIRIKKQHES